MHKLFVSCILSGFYFWSLSFYSTAEIFAINKVTKYVNESCMNCDINYCTKVYPFYSYLFTERTGLQTGTKFIVTGSTKSLIVCQPLPKKTKNHDQSYF